MKKLLTLMLAALLLAGCAAQPQPIPEPVQPEPEAISGGEVEVLPETVTDFAPVEDFSFALFSEALKRGELNPVLSPLSAYLCLAMLQNGAAGDTLSEFETLLGADGNSLNALSRALIEALHETAGETTLRIANSAWADDDGVELLNAFVQRVADGYGAEVFSADLPSDAARKAVNAWVEEQTQGLIPTLREDNYPPETVLTLINTLYFKARWDSPFMADSTFDGDFTLTGGETVQTPFMHKYEAYFDYIEGEGAEGVVLPYDDGRTVFVALKPAAGGDARALAQSLTAEKLSVLLAAGENACLDLALPKYELSYALELNDALKSLGLTRVFDPAAADLSALGSARAGALYLSLVQQKVKLIVDERGTEAAAVTEAAAAGAALGPEPLRLYFDSPFVYAIVDLYSGVPLIMGVLDDPRG